MNELNYKLIDFYGFQIHNKKEYWWELRHENFSQTILAYSKDSTIHFLLTSSLRNLSFNEILIDFEEPENYSNVLNSIRSFTSKINILSSLKPIEHNQLVIKYYDIKRAKTFPSLWSDIPNLELFFSKKLDSYCYPLSQDKEICNLAVITGTQYSWFLNTRPGIYSNSIKTDKPTWLADPITAIELSSENVILTNSQEQNRGEVIRKQFRSLDYQLSIQRIFENETIPITTNYSGGLKLTFHFEKKLQGINQLSLINTQLKKHYQYSSNTEHSLYPDLASFSKAHLLEIIDKNEGKITVKYDPTFKNILTLYKILQDQNFKFKYDFSFI